MFKRLKRKGKKGKVNLQNVKQKIDPRTAWNVGRKIGEGAMGIVFEAASKSSATVCAAKILKIESKDDIEEFATEVDALVPVKHPNVVRLHDAFMYQKKFWIVLEMCKGGAFDDILIARKGRGLSEPQVKSSAKQILAGMAHLHNLGIYHRDIKGSNLLLHENGTIKLTDFGSCSIGNLDGRRRDTFLGSPYWMAPEVIECDDSSIAHKEGYNHKADVWAYGITLIELAQCDPPYQELNPMRAMLRITKNLPPSLDQPQLWSRAFSDFLDMSLQKEQEIRSTAAELLQHEFVSGSPDYKCLLPLLAHSSAADETSPSARLAAQLQDTAGADEENFGW